MAVARVGSTVGPYWSGNSGTLAWPGGSAAGHVAVVNVYGTTSSARTLAASGWINFKHTPSTDHFWKVLTSTDVASALVVSAGYAAALTVYSGAGRIGAVSDLGTSNPGATTTAADSMVHVSGRGKTTLTPSGSLGSDVVLTAYSNRHYNLWVLTGSAIGWYGLTGFNGTDSTSVEIVPTAGPSAPTISAPLAAYVVSAAAACVLSWVHRSAQNGTPDGYSVKIVKDGATTYYLTGAGALTATVTTVGSSAQTATVAAGQLVSGSTYVMTVQTSEGGVWSAWSPSVTFSAITAPTVSTVTVSSPAGTLTPAVSWTESVTGGQSAYQVRICLAADSAPDVPLWDSGAVSGPDLSDAAPAINWANGQSLKAWVRVQQPGLWSAWVASSAFTVSWTPPAAPSTVTAANQASGPLRVTVAGVTAPALTVPIPNLVVNGGFGEGVASWELGSGMGSADAGRLKCLRTPGTGANTRQRLPMTSSHTYYVAVTLTGGTAGATGFYLAGDVLSTTSSAERLSKVVTGWANLYFEIFDNRSTGTVFYADNAIAIDMTAVFGAGNEKTKAQMDAFMSTWSGSWFDGTYDPAADHEVQVQASADAGATWGDVNSAAPTTTTAVIDAPGAAYGVATLYRARQRTPFLGAPLWSDWTTAGAAVASTDTACYMVGDDGTWRSVRVRQDDAPEREEQFSAFYGLDATTARVDSGPAQGWSGVTTVGTRTRAEWLDLMAWIDAHPVWTWRWSPERSGSTYADAGSIRVTRAAGFRPARLAQVAISARDIPIGWTEQQ